MTGGWFIIVLTTLIGFRVCDEIQLAVFQATSGIVGWLQYSLHALAQFALCFATWWSGSASWEADAAEVAMDCLVNLLGLHPRRLVTLSTLRRAVSPLCDRQAWANITSPPEKEAGAPPVLFIQNGCLITVLPQKDNLKIWSTWKTSANHRNVGQLQNRGRRCGMREPFSCVVSQRVVGAYRWALRDCEARKAVANLGQS